jgi:hypothetical protein
MGRRLPNLHHQLAPPLNMDVAATNQAFHSWQRAHELMEASYLFLAWYTIKCIDQARLDRRAMRETVSNF